MALDLNKHLSGRANPIEQEPYPNPAPEADVSHHRARLRRQRVHGGCDSPPIAAVHHHADQMS